MEHLFTQQTLEELNDEIVQSRAGYPWRQWGKLFKRSRDINLARRKRRIIHTMFKFRIDAGQEFHFGSLVVLSLEELLSIAAYKNNVFLVRKNIEAKDSVQLRHFLARKLSRPVGLWKLKPRGRSHLIANIPLRHWFTPEKIIELKELFAACNSEGILWEYIRHIPQKRMRRLFKEHNLTWTKTPKLNQYILHAALGEVPPPFLSWCHLSYIWTTTKSPINKLLLLLKEQPFQALDYTLAIPEDGAFEDRCAICLVWMAKRQRVKIRQTKCGHCFHKLCIHQWLASNKTCPLCKTLLT